MKDISTAPEKLESTYSLLVRSEEKQRSWFETLIYTVLIVSALFALTQFGRQALIMPVNVVHATPVAAAPIHHGA